MKTTIRIPTKEQYAFIELEVDETPERVVEIYNEYTALVNQTDVGGLDPKSWRESLDRYLKQGDMEADKYDGMSKAQKYVIQEIKKAFKRLESNENKIN